MVDHRGNAWANNIGFDFPEGEFAPGFVVHIAPDGVARQVADGLAFPNGIAVTADGATLIVAESYAEQLSAYDIDAGAGIVGRRVWAATPGDPSGRHLPRCRGRRLVRRRRQPALRAGPRGRRDPDGVVDFDRGAFSCVVGDGDDPRLYFVGQDWGDEPGPSGVVRAYPTPVGR